MSHDDEDDGQEYECQNEGCPGDGIFCAAPESWFWERGLNLPSNCPDCKEWIEGEKEIGPVTAKCQFCGYVWSIEASYRIMYHKNVGDWDDYWEENEDNQLCRMCEEFPGRRRKLEIRDRKKLYKNDPEAWREARRYFEEKEKESVALLQYLEESGLDTTSKRYEVPDSLEFYRSVKTPADLVDQHGPTQLTHIMKKEHDWVGRVGTNDPRQILAIGKRISASREDHVKQFRDSRSGMLIKFDVEQRIAVVLRGDKKSPTGNRIHTCFQVDSHDAMRRIKNRRWIIG